MRGSEDGRLDPEGRILAGVLWKEVDQTIATGIPYFRYLKQSDSGYLMGESMTYWACIQEVFHIIRYFVAVA